MSPFKILIVEDDAIESLDIQKRLELLGYEVPYVASRGQEAIDKASQIMPDLVLMDISLKGDMDGIDAASEIIKLDIPIVYLTAHSDEATVKKAKFTQPYGYLIKPYDPNELKYALELAIYKSKNDKKLKESYAISKALLNSSNDSVFLTNTKGIILDINEAATLRLGFDKKQLIGSHFKEFINPKIAKTRWKHFENVIKTKKPVEFEDERDGIIFEHRIIPILENGEVQKLAAFSRDITDKKISEKLIIESEKRYKTIFDNSGSASILFDNNGLVLMVNSEWENVSGYSKEEVVGKIKWMELVHPDYLDLMMEYHQKRESKDSSVPSKYESCFVKKDGSSLYMYVSVVPVPGKNEWLASAIDISDLKKIQAELLLNEERLRSIFDSSKDYIYSYDSNGRFTSASQELCKDLQLREDQIIGKTHEELGFPEKQSKEWSALHAEVYKKDRTVSALTSTPLPDGKIRDYEVVLNPIHDTSGKIIGISGISRDISERKKAEESLKLNEERLSLAIQGANAALFDWNIETGHAYFSPEYYQMFGYEPGDFPATYDSWVNIIHPDDREKTIENLNKQFKNKLEHFKIEYRVICKDGTEKWILGLAKGNEFDKKGIVTRLIGINLDITRRKALEEKLELTQYSVDKAQDLIFWINSQGKIVYTNETATAKLGYSKKEFQSMTIFNDISPYFDAEKWQDHWNEIKIVGNKTMEIQIPAKDGKLIDVSLAINLIDFKGTLYHCDFARDITQQKEIELQLTESQRTLETLMSNLPGMAYRCKNDPQWTMEFVSEGCEELTGYSAEDLIDNKNLSYASLIHPDDLQKVWDEVQLALSQQKPFQVYYRIIDANSQTKFILEKGKGIFSDEGELLTLEGFISDISEQKIAEEKLIESENYLYKIINTISDPVFVKNRNHVWELVNTAFCEFIGHSNEELVGKSDYDFFPEHEADVFWEKDEEVFITKKENINEEKITTSPGHTHTIITKKTIYNDKTGADHLVGVIRDVTDLKNVQKSLKKQYKFLQNLMDSIPNPIFYKDINYKYRGCNTAFEEVLGISKKSIIGKTVYELNPPEISEKFHKKDQELFENPGTQNYEAPVKYADGTIHEILFVKNTYNDPNGNLAGMIGVMSDITGIRNAEKALQSSEREYREVFENMDTALAVYEAVNDGENFMIKDFNRAGARIEQVSRKKVIGKKITEAFPGAIEFGLFDVLKRVWKTGTPERFPISLYKDERISGWRENYVYKLASGEVVAVYDDLTEKKQAEEEIILNQNRLKSLVKILQYNPESVQELLDYALKEAIGLTKSKIGYIYHYYPDKEQFILNTWSKGVMEKCSVKEAPEVYDLSKTGIWGEAVRQKKSFIINDFQAPNSLKKGYPNGHTPLYKYMTLPVFSRNEIVAVVGVANKEEDYSETDLLQLELLMDAVWKVVDRQKFEEALKVSETQYKAIFENTGTATAISEENMVLSLANEEFCKLTGYSKEEIENKMTWTEFFVEDQLERMEKYHRLRRVNPEKAPKNYESQVIDKKGTVKDVFMSVSMIPNTKKSLVSVLDITEKRQSRIELKRELKINQSLARVYVPLISPNSTLDDVASVILKEAKELTGSNEGFVSSIDPKTGYNIVHTLTKMMPNCKVMLEEESVIFPKGTDGKYNGLWGYSLNTGESFFTNYPENHEASQGVPKGHIKLDRFLSIPVFLGKNLVGQIALANSPRNYSQKDIDSIKRIAEFYALAIHSKESDKEIRNSLEEKDTLLREIHHRVKNNMQIISSLLNLQKYWDSDLDPLELIEDSQNRIRTMSIVHELLYQSENLSKVDLKVYIQKLTYYLFEQYSASSRRITLWTDLEDGYLNIETSVPCCLIVNELVSNSLKHAFTSDGGEIQILFHKINGKYELIVKDNGIGLPEDFDLEKSHTLGLFLVNNLIDQIDGELEVKNDNGAEFRIIFEELIYKQRV